MGSQKTGSGKFASSKLDHKCSDSRYFSAEQKHMIIDAYLKDHVPLVQLCKAYHVSRISIWRWITNFVDSRGSHNRETSQKDTTQPPISMPQKEVKPVESPEEELARLRAENKRLEEALKMAEWSNHAKDVIIDLAEKTFNIPIRKKSGAKQ